jgi:hypothetical protein
MRLPRFRLRVLLLMVALVAIGLGLWRRWSYFGELANYHSALARSYAGLLDRTVTEDFEDRPELEVAAPEPRPDQAGYNDERDFVRDLAAWHERMGRYYRSRW